MWRAKTGALLMLLCGACVGEDRAPDDAARASTSRDTAMMAAEPVPAPAAASDTPRLVPRVRFEDYAVADTFRGTPAASDLASAEYGRLYRTVLRQGAAAGPNFAGRYTVVTWGCGTGCQVNAVVDARTGRLSRQTLLTNGGLEYRLDSALLFADPPQPDQPPQCASCGTPAYFVWRSGRFEPLGPGPHPQLEGHRPWS